jgi:glycine cleavage system aminomethyltransferase T
VDTAKQIVVCNPRGYVIGDAILFYLADQSFNIVGRPPVANWVQYHVESGKYNRDGGA